MKKFKLIALILLLGSVASCGKESISNSTISSTLDKKLIYHRQRRQKQSMINSISCCLIWLMDIDLKLLPQH